MLDVTRLRVLVAVARHGSVTAAARALNYAQPSVSHHLARLEAETGARLLQRAGRSVRLTDAGLLLAERAEEIIGRLDAAEAELAAHVGLREDRVRLAAFGSALGTIVPAAAAELQAREPRSDLMLAQAEPPEAVRMLRAGSADVALVFRHFLDDAPADTAPASWATADGAGSAGGGLRVAPLLDEPVYLVTRAGSGRPGTVPDAAAAAGPDGAAAPVGLAELAGYAGHRWIGGCERCRAQLIRHCARAGFTPKISFATDDYVAVQSLVAAGLGVTTLPGLALRAARHPGVEAIPLAGARRQVCALTYGAPPDPPATVRLLAALTVQARALAPS
jgi:DNA-binding transcriptional LysR family regulator